MTLAVGSFLLFKSAKIRTAPGKNHNERKKEKAGENPALSFFGEELY